MNVFRFEFVWILYTTPVRIWCASGMYVGGSECFYGDGTNPQNCDRSHKNDRTYVRFVSVKRIILCEKPIFIVSDHKSNELSAFILLLL